MNTTAERVKAQHTQGPWRWEVNESSKSVHLVGGKPQYDLTIIDFERWGMNGATMRLRDPLLDGMNLMDRCTKWAINVKGREHHAGWFKDIDHPDARLIAAAPDLLSALERVMALNCPLTGNPSNKTLVEFWEEEKLNGRGGADEYLFALAVIAKVKGGAA